MRKLMWSNYLVVFEEDEYIYLHNTITDATYRLSKNEWNLINSFLNNNVNIENENTKKHISELILCGIIVEDTKNEIKQFKNDYLLSIQNSSYGTIYFAPSFNCNLRCKYCIIGENVNDEKKCNKKMSKDIVDQTAKWIFETSKYYCVTNLDILLYGGEPTLSIEENLQLMRKLNDLNNDETNSNKININYKLISNGYNIQIEQIKKLIKLGLNSIQITLDGPPEIHNARRYGINKVRTFDNILKNIITLTQYFKDFVIRVNVDNENAPYISQLVDILYENNLHKSCLLHFNLVDPSDFSSNSGYNEETICFFTQIYKNAFEKGFNVGQWKRYCSLPSKFYFSIDHNGFIYKCPNYMGNNKKIIGNVCTKKIKDSNYCVIKDKCLECKFIGMCNGGCEVMRETSFIGNEYCFSKENYMMTKLYLIAKHKYELPIKKYLKLFNHQ